MGVKMKAADVKEVLKLAGKKNVRLPTEEKTRFVDAMRHLKEHEGDKEAAVTALAKQFGTKRKMDQEKEKKEEKEEDEVVDNDEEDHEDDGESDDTKKPKKKRAKTQVRTEIFCEENRPLVEAFRELQRYEFDVGQRFKGAAYAKVATALAGLDYKVESGQKCMEMKGIGKASANKIDEFLQTGKIETLENARAERE
mmetsp:Transcript_13120/g.40382  ORF Transcript_13120/g.40382 Transcript_13120/m.40382 type:complete len:197 (-) Transcript_13120:1790-2380(-)